MVKSLLPIGSVVLLNGGTRRLMICGRVQTNVSTGTTYDYSACLYPEGVIDSNEFYMFNNDNIQKIFFIGFQDEEEFKFKEFLSQQLGENKGSD